MRLGEQLGDGWRGDLPDPSPDVALDDLDAPVPGRDILNLLDMVDLQVADMDEAVGEPALKKKREVGTLADGDELRGGKRCKCVGSG